MISFVIPLHNHLPHTQEMLTSLLASLPADLDFEVILVDDASSDGTAAWLRKLSHPRVRAVFNPENLGYAASNNQGVAEARGEILGLLNNDLIFSPGWLEPMLHLLNDPMARFGLLGNVQRRVVDGEIDHAGVGLNLKGQFEHLTTLPPDAEHAVVSWVTGACVLIRRDLFEALGGFDTRYRNGCEDIDLCFRVQQAGKQVGIAYNSVIRHHVSLSRGHHVLQNERNSCALFARWRHEIKNALAQVWRRRLTAPQQDETSLDGELDESLVSTPHIASRMLAEQQIALQALRWARLFEVEESNPRLGFSASGVASVLNGVCPCSRQFRINLTGCRVIAALNVCGQLLPSSPQETLGICIDVNHLHRKHFTVKRGAAFNLHFSQPLTLPRETNVLYVTVDGVEGDDGEAVLSSLVFNQAVIDGVVLGF